MSVLEDRLYVLVKTSRIAGWCFGPILYSIGTLHARALPKAVPEFLSFFSQVAMLSFPLCVGKYYLISAVLYF